MTPLDPSVAQRDAALRLANEVRLRRGAVKRAVAAGELDWQDALEDPALARMKVLDLVLKVPKMGGVRAAGALRDAAIPANKLLGTLTGNQKRNLQAAVEGRLQLYKPLPSRAYRELARKHANQPATQEK